MPTGHDRIVGTQTVRDALLTTLNEDMSELFSRVETLEGTDFTRASRNETITGSWLFPDPSLEGNPATKKYVHTHFALKTVGLPTGAVIAVTDYGARGDGSTDDTEAILSAIAAAQQRVLTANYRSGIVVYFPSGIYRITGQIVIPNGIIIATDGILSNNLSNKYEYAMLFRPGAHIHKLQMWGNLGSGVKLGEEGYYCDMLVGEIRLWNIGEEYHETYGPKIGVRFAGYNFTVDSIQVDGGNIGVDINLASDVRLNKALLFTGSTGMRITSASEHICLGSIVVDTPNYIGMQIDSSHDIYIANLRVFINDIEYNGELEHAIIVGKYSSSNKVNGLVMNAVVQNTGGGALSVNNIRGSRLSLIATNAILETGNSHPVSTGITYGSGVEDSLHIDANIGTDVTTPISGTVAGTLILSRGGNLYKQDGVGGIETM